MSSQFSKVYACYVWKQWEIWLQNCKMDTENNPMHVNPKHKWCMEKSNFLKKQSNLMQKLLKTQYLMNEMHEYEIKSFSKKTWIQPRSSKNKIFNQFVLKSQILQHILHQNQGTCNLGWPQQDHTQYNVPSLAKSNLYSVCN